jgi:predicted enzyme related to lactoylglutathione lyase
MTTRTDLGRFVWHDLMSTDAAASGRFYTGLFPEWKLHSAQSPGGDLATIHVGDRAIGCLIPFDKAHGVPSHWVGYVAVESCDATVARMEQLGGKSCYPPVNFPGVGRFAMMSDPQGAYIKPIQLEKPFPMPDMPSVGSMCWNELLTTEVEAAKAFYTAVFGWETVSHDMGTMVYTLFRKAGKDVGGAMTMPAGMQAPPHWLYYLLVEDVDARTRKVPDLGGQVCVPPTDIPGIGRFSVLSDPAGAVVALFKSVKA